MPVFKDYARYYNLLYRDKDYAGESAFVVNALRRHGREPKTLLDLGCGTGRHALAMARAGIAVTGVDMSETMLALGQATLNAHSPAEFPPPDLRCGDARAARLGKTFDAVVSLFHVMSYQNTEDDALAVMETARAHLKPGGLFLFDFWHGPGVLRDPPERRERNMEDGATRVRRVAVPEHRVNDNLVIVNYSVTLTTPDGISRLNESHSMRYWFLPELRRLARQAGFAVLREGGWMHDAPPSLADWNAWMLASA
ncbi:MAG: class I SAM-dependent methyltransferase [Desulfovibrio sp.]|jgi:SAM-dependent methyltransferase|nr:class I SAM-dependent methyltransferase [Desulfovibrio sp.]